MTRHLPIDDPPTQASLPRWFLASVLLSAVIPLLAVAALAIHWSDMPGMTFGLKLVGAVLIAVLPISIAARWLTREVAIRFDQLAAEKLACEVTQRHAEAANQAKSDFLANMSHEVRTPLNGILGYTELLVRGADEGNEHERQDFLQAIRDSGRQLLNLVNDILDISKIESGSFRVELVPFSPDKILTEVVASQRLLALQKGLSLSSRWDSPIPATIETDPQRLNQLLTNLIANAIKFTARGSIRIVVSLEETDEGSKLHFEVRDTGVGIAPKKLQDIFEPFLQGDDTLTRPTGSTGLGLAICRRIARSLGGDLTVRSVPGEGSFFTATIATGDLFGVRMCDTSGDELSERAARKSACLDALSRQNAPADLNPSAATAALPLCLDEPPTDFMLGESVL